MLCLNRVYVHLIVHETNNCESSAEPLRSKPTVHKRGCYSLKLLDGRSRANIAHALAEGESCRSIARRLHHSIHTVLAVRDADWKQIAARKERIAAQCERNATVAAEQLAERLETEKLSANQLVPVLGVSVDKMLALRGDNIQTLHHIHSFDPTDDDLIAWMCCDRAQEVGIEQFTRVRRKLLQQEQSAVSPKVIEAEIVTDQEG